MIKILLIFFLSIFSSHIFADELKLHFMRSPLGINWKDPWHLSASTLKNQLINFKNKRAYHISHVFVEIKCDSTDQHIYRGMTSSDESNEKELLLKQGYGLGVMFHTYPGFLEHNDVVIRDLAPYVGNHRHNTLTIKVSPSTCQRMISYANDFEARGFGKKYAGLQGDPLKGEGAGCSAFGVSFLRVAGLMDDFTEEWKEIIDVPTRLVGGEMTGNKVRFTKILTSILANWSDKEPHIHLEAWNPERMHAWVKKMYDQVKKENYQGLWKAKASKFKNSHNITLDMSERSTPTGSWWLF